MINLKQVRKSRFGNKGFTLIEILIVVMVLGILAMVIVPQITVSTQDAKTSTLETNLAAMRNAIELYYVQHDNVYPGGTGADAAAAATDFVAQLTKYTNAAGGTSDTVAATHPFGPYIKNGVLPTNPFNSLATVACDVSVDITATPLVTVLDDTGWYFYHKTGKLLAWDGS